MIFGIFASFWTFLYNLLLHFFQSKPMTTEVLPSKRLFSVFNKRFVSTFFRPVSNPSLYFKDFKIVQVLIAT